MCITFLIKHVYNIPDPVYNIPDPVYNIPDHVGPLNCFLRRGFVGNPYDSSQVLSRKAVIYKICQASRGVGWLVAMEYF